jgi:GNAT superfamily N-acetyltransferase
VNIVDLREAPQHIGQLARWHHRQWADLYPDESVSDCFNDLQRSLGASWLPSTFVALDGTRLLGSASLVVCDMHTHPELSPWVASVYVASECRGQGIGAALIRHIMEHARAAGVAALYLFTPSSEDFYRKLGWRLLRREPYQGVEVGIMVHAFA